jgi:hypothetical protein
VAHETVVDTVAGDDDPGALPTAGVEEEGVVDELLAPNEEYFTECAGGSRRPRPILG